MAIISYDKPSYPADLYGPTYKMWPLELYANDPSCNIDADFANYWQNQQSTEDSSINWPYPFGYANFFGSNWGSGIQMKLPGSQGCQIPCRCCK